MNKCTLMIHMILWLYFIMLFDVKHMVMNRTCSSMSHDLGDKYCRLVGWLVGWCVSKINATNDSFEAYAFIHIQIYLFAHSQN